MSLIQQPKYLPVFHHIPKSGGTYVLSWAQMLCRIYHIMKGDNQQQCWTSARIRRFFVEMKNGRQLTVVYYTPTDLTGSPDGILKLYNCKNDSGKLDKSKLFQAQIHYIKRKFGSHQNSPDANVIKPDAFLSLVQAKEVVPFFISIDPIFFGASKSPDHQNSWEDARNFIHKVVAHLKRERRLDFTVLRNPYDRALSLYDYIKSDRSSHEANHDCLTATSFEEYIQSKELEDSWFIRSLMDMSNSTIIEPYHLTFAHEGYLKKFLLSDISKVDDLINSVFHGIYGIQQSHVEEHVAKASIDKNATSNKSKIKLEDLDPTIQQKFLDRTYWDRKLWERYCKNV